MITATILTELVKNSERLYDLTRRLSYGNDDAELQKSAQTILGSARKLIIARELYNRAVICVTGLQGTGKTTMMQGFYHIDEQYLNITELRGEIVPVLITEKKDCTVPEPYVTVLAPGNDDTSVTEVRPVTPEEFVQASATGQLGDLHAVLLELKVPYQHTRNDNLSFMLLPGFEKKKDYWRSLIDFSVKCADSAIFTFAPSDFAGSQTASRIEEIQRVFGEHCIYAVTHADTESEASIASLRQNCLETLQIPESDSDRIVFVGAFTGEGAEEKNDAWIHALKKSISRYCSTEDPADYSESYIREEIEEVMLPELYELRDVLNHQEGEEIWTKLEKSGWLSAFDELKQKHRGIFEKQLEIALRACEQESLHRVEAIYTERGADKKHNVKKPSIIRRILSGGTTAKDEIRAREIVKTSLEDHGSGLLAQKGFVEALDGTLDRIGSDSTLHSLVKNDRGISGMLSMANRTKQSEETSLTLTEQEHQRLVTISQDMTTFLTKGNDGQLIETDARNIIKMSVELSTIAFATGSVFGLDRMKHIPSAQLSKSQLDLEKIQKGADDSVKLAVGVASVLGFDLLDGSPDILNGLMTALSIPAPVAIGVVGGLLAVGAGTVIARDVGRMKYEDLVACRRTVTGCYESIRQEYLDLYDDYMDGIRDKLEERLISMSGCNRKAVDNFNLMNAVNSTEQKLREIKDQLKGTGAYESAFQ